jgi:exodeoxyribonuclease III
MPRIILSLLEHTPDIICLSEFRRTTGGQISGMLADHGWTHQHSTNPPAGTNGLLVASRHPLLVGRSERPPVVCAHALAAAGLRLLEVETAGLSVISVHVPCGGSRGKRSAREHVFQCLIAAARRGRDGRTIIVGDLNAGRHRLDEEGATFTCTRLLGQLASLGYVDAWRRMNPEGREFSWFSPDGAGFRIDHALVSQALAPHVALCCYAHQERETGVSDHSALVLGLS